MIAISIRRLERSLHARSFTNALLSRALRNGSYAQLPKQSGSNTLGPRSFAGVTAPLEGTLIREGKAPPGTVQDKSRRHVQEYHCSVYSSTPDTFVCVFLLLIYSIMY